MEEEIRKAKAQLELDLASSLRTVKKLSINTLTAKEGQGKSPSFVEYRG